MAHTIVLAVDSDSVYEFIQNIPIEDVELVRAKTPEEAEKKIQELVPEAIVIDSDLAEGKGKEFLEKIKKDPTFGAIPVIYLKDVFEESQEELPVEWVLNKPFTKEDFVEALKSVLGEDVTLKEEAPSEEGKEEKEEEEKTEEEEVVDLAALEEAPSEEGEEEEVIDLSELEKEKEEEEEELPTEEAPKEKIEEAAEVVTQFEEVFEKGEPTPREFSDIEKEFLDKLQEYISYVVERKLEDILSKYEIKLVKKSD